MELPGSDGPEQQPFGWAPHPVEGQPLYWPVVDPDSVAWQPPPGWSPQPPPPPAAYPETPEWPTPDPPPGNRRTAMFATILIAALVITVVAVSTVMVTGGQGSNTSNRASPPVPSVPAVVPEPGSGGPAPVVPGWQVITDGGAAVDVPPDWTVEPGIAPGGGMDNEAVYQKGACGTDTSFRARVVQMSDASGELSLGAKNIAQSIVSSYYANDNPQLDTGEPPIPTTEGTLADYPITVSLTPTNSCDPPRALIHVVAAQGDKGGTFAIVVVADQGVPGAANPDDLSKIAMSVRPTS